MDPGVSNEGVAGTSARVPSEHGGGSCQAVRRWEVGEGKGQWEAVSGDDSRFGPEREEKARLGAGVVVCKVGAGLSELTASWGHCSAEREDGVKGGHYGQEEERWLWGRMRDSVCRDRGRQKDRCRSGGRGLSDSHCPSSGGGEGKAVCWKSAGRRDQLGWGPKKRISGDLEPLAVIGE